MKDNKKIVGVVILILAVVQLSRQGEQSVKEFKKMAGTVTRSFSAITINPGGSVVVTYTPSAGDWSLDEVLPTGWTVQGTPLYNQYLREYFSISSPITYTFVASTTPGTYTFSQGQWQMGSDNNVWSKFATQTITVQQGCSADSSCTTFTGECKTGKCNLNTGQCYSENKADGITCSDGKCSSGECLEDVCVTDCTCAAITPVGQTCSNGCGGLCQGTQQTSCVPNWQCTAWSVCSSLCQKTRTCTDTNHCNVQCGDASCVTADACTGDSCVATQTCSQGGFYCCPTGYTCNDIRSGTGCVGT